MSVVGSSTTTIQPQPGGEGVALVILVVVSGFLLWVGAHSLAGAIALDLYRGVIEVPNGIRPLPWSTLGLNVLSGALAGLLIGVLRHKRRGLAAEALADAALTPELIASGRLGLATVLFHLVLGAGAGALLALIGLVSPLQLLGGHYAVDTSAPVLALLTGAGMFNGGGAPPAALDLWLIMFVILLLVVLATIVLGMLASGLAGFAANLLLASATRATGSAAGGILARLAGARVEEDGAKLESGWIWRAMLTGFLAGTWTGSVSTLLVLTGIYLARGRIGAAMPGPVVDAPSVHELPGLRFVAQSRDRRTLYAIASDEVHELDVVSGREDQWSPSEQGERARRLWEEERIGVGEFEGARGWPGDSDPDPIRARQVTLHMIAGRPTLFDERTGAPLRAMEAPPRVTEVTLAGLAAGRLAGWVGYPEHYVVVWDVASGRILRRFQGPADWPYVELSPDGRILLMKEGSRLRLWDLDGARSWRLAGPAGELRTFAWSEDGRMLATGAEIDGDRGEARLWDLSTGRAVWQATGRRISEILVGPRYVALPGDQRFTVYRVH
jgi:hypothetical protein